MDDGNATNDTTGGRVARASRVTETPKKKLGGNQSCFEAIIIATHDIVQGMVRDYSLRKTQVRTQWCNYRKSQRPVTGGTVEQTTTTNGYGGAQKRKSRNTD